MQLPDGGFQRKSLYTVLIMGREMKDVEEVLCVMKSTAPFTPFALLSSIPSTLCSVLFLAELFTRAVQKI